MNELPQGPAGQDIQVQVGPQGQIGEVGPPPPLQTTFSAGEIVLFFVVKAGRFSLTLRGRGTML